MAKRKSKLTAHEIASIKAIGAHKALTDLEKDVGKLYPNVGDGFMKERVLTLIRKKAAACIEGSQKASDQGAITIN